MQKSAPFDGDFVAWFREGSHFITSADLGPQTVVRVYTPDATLVQTFTFPRANTSLMAGGEGSFVWIHPAGEYDLVKVYSLGQAEPVFTFRGISWTFPSPHTAPVFTAGDDVIALLDLRGEAPAISRRSLPSGKRGVIVADDAGRVAYADGSVVHDGTEPLATGGFRAFGCHVLQRMIGWRDRLVTASEDNVLRLYSFRSGAPELMWKRQGMVANALAFMDDGRYLVVSGRDELDARMTLHIHELDDDGRLLRAMPRAERLSQSSMLTTSSEGARFARTWCSAGVISKEDVHCTVHLTTLARDAASSDEVDYLDSWQIALSPDGRRFALLSALGTSIYDNDLLLGTIRGVYPELWLDADRVIVNDRPTQPSRIVDVMGKTLSTLDFPTVGILRAAGNGLFHDDENVYRQTDGKVLLRQPRMSGGGVSDLDRRSAVVAGRFVYQYAGSIYLKPIPAAP